MILAIPGLAAQGGLVHGFSTSALGSMARGARGSPLTPARRAFAERLALDPEALTVAGAVHGSRVQRVDGPSGVVREVDGLVTDRTRLPLLVTAADCYPILLWDPLRRALGLAHAGWRGTAAGIAGRAVAALRREFGCRPRDLVAGIGPGICGGCYEVSDAVAGRFPASARRSCRPGHSLLDLAAANRAQLEAAGVRSDQIHVHGACTRESPELPSHRRSPDGTRFACLAAIR